MTSDNVDGEVVGADGEPERLDELWIYQYQAVLVAKPSRVPRAEAPGFLAEARERLGQDQWLVVVDPRTGNSTTIDLAGARQHLAALYEDATRMAAEMTAMNQRILSGYEQSAHALRALQLEFWNDIDRAMREARDRLPGATLKDAAEAAGGAFAEVAKKWAEKQKGGR